MKKWDVFISHASEDKKKVALPLSKSLEKAGIKVWLDFNELTIGDSLREKIDEGLAQSHFGIIIVSEEFLSKEWPKKELNGLFALEEGNQKVILPLWYNVDKKLIAGYSPILADRLASNWKDGLDQITNTISSVIFKEARKANSEMLSVKGRLMQLYEAHPTKSEIKSFLNRHKYIIASAMMCDEEKVSLRKKLKNEQSEVYKLMPDFVQSTPLTSIGRESVVAVFLGSPKEDIDFSERLEKMKQRMLYFIEEKTPNYAIKDLTCIGIIGRRKVLTENDRLIIDSFSLPELKPLQKLTPEERGKIDLRIQTQTRSYPGTIITSIRTYDWLLELA